MKAQHGKLAWQLCAFLGVWTSTAKKPYFFVIFQQGPEPLPSPSGPALYIVLNKLDLHVGSKYRRIGSYNETTDGMQGETNF